MDQAVATLARAAQRGDREAFAALIGRFERTALAVAYGVLNCPESAGDVVQESFIAAWKGIDRLEEPEKFPAWLCQIVRRAAIDGRRKRMRERRMALDAATYAPTVTDDASDRHDAQSDVAQAMAHLDDMSRSVIALRYYQGLSSKDIAATLGVTPGAVDMRLSRARQELREYLSAGAEL